MHARINQMLEQLADSLSDEALELSRGEAETTRGYASRLKELFERRREAGLQATEALVECREAYVVAVRVNADQASLLAMRLSLGRAAARAGIAHALADVAATYLAVAQDAVVDEVVTELAPSPLEEVLQQAASCVMPEGAPPLVAEVIRGAMVVCLRAAYETGEGVTTAESVLATYQQVLGEVARAASVNKRSHA